MSVDLLKVELALTGVVQRNELTPAELTCQ